LHGRIGESTIAATYDPANQAAGPN